MTDDLKQTALEKLSVPPSREALVKWISWLDLQFEDIEYGSLPFQLLARSIVALGYLLLEKKGYMDTVANTLRAGENFALDPCEQNWDAFADAATMSYPFGPGQGCFSVKETGYEGCKRGSGCSSGAGSLACQGLDDTEVMQAVSRELIPWLNGEDDPVISRENHV